MSAEDGLECPVCWEGFNDAENTPYVLWCGHSLCKTCVIGLQWAVIKFPGLPLQLPLFIACPWCQFLTCRITWKGNLKYPCKNFFLLWILESLRGDNVRQRPHSDAVEGVACGSPMRPPTSSVVYGVRPRQLRVPSEHHQRSGTAYLLEAVQGSWDMAHWQNRLARTVSLFVQFTAKLPLVFLFLFIICYVLPFSTLILAVYCVVTVLFAVPSFLVVYFSFPSLDWLAREIVT
ncbi:hypothetical protein Mapa_004477 [Marchantia paleacea]|nr:hypothetical protein Mapa_004477 [Marchantia paleacea]